MTTDPGGAREATLTARDLRIAIDDVVVVDAMSTVTSGTRVLLVGDAAPLMSVLTGIPLTPFSPSAVGQGRARTTEVRIVSGELRLAGRSVATGEHFLCSGAAPLDPPLPPKWSVLSYVLWGARLAGAGKRMARELSRAALDRLGLGPFMRRELGTLLVPERRALVLAQAIVMSPEVIVVESPLSGLDDRGVAFVLAALAAASEGRRTVLSVSRVVLGGPEELLARSATDVVILREGDVVISGSPAELFRGGRLYALTVRSHADLLAAELNSRGIECRGGPLRFSARLPDGTTTRDIVAAAVRARASIIELVPVIES